MSGKRSRRIREILNRELPWSLQSKLIRGIQKFSEEGCRISHNILIRRMKKAWNKGIDIRKVVA